MPRRNMSPEEVRVVAQGRAAQLAALTEQAISGNFDAFCARQQMLSRNPVELGMKWQQFQRGSE